MRKFIKYGNRKLYDKTQHSYTTLQKIRQLVANGEEIVITEKKTGQDITNQTLFNALTPSDFSNTELLTIIKKDVKQNTILNTSN